MSNIPKAYLGLFMVVLTVVLAIGFIAQDKQASNAVSIKNDIVEELQCSNFNPSVIQECKDTCDSLGFEADITPVVDASGETIMCEVLVKYDYVVPFVNTHIEQQVRGFAR